MWEDNTIDYFLGTTEEAVYQPVCFTPTENSNLLMTFNCRSQVRGSHEMSMCQLPQRSRQLHHHVGSGSSAIMTHDQQTRISSPSTGQQKQLSIARVKVTVQSLKTNTSGQWRPVTCDRGHLTHVLLACDTSTICLAGGDVTFSRHSDTWATPTSESCPIPLVVPPLPPSFLCRFEGQRVPYSLVCDHRRDCLDGSDEVFCDFPPCLIDSQFQCRNRQVCHASLYSLR